MNDISSSKDNVLVRRAFLSIISELQGTSNQSNDHRYKGIANAWIRYISGGKTAYRLIYIKNGPDIIFYRCGVHDIEENLTAPNLVPTELAEFGQINNNVEEMTQPKTFLTNHVGNKLTLTALLGRRLIPNKQAWIVSPFVSPQHLQRTSGLGQLLDTLVDSGTQVFFITSQTKVREYLNICRDLESREVEVCFVESLHAKIYLFLTDHDHWHETSNVPSLGIIGSSNLTRSGIANDFDKGNREVNFTVPTDSIVDLTELVENYYSGSKNMRQALKS
jgi:hypothetical protein